MDGLYKFDFYIRDWITSTRGLSPAARGVLMDILAAIYLHGGPIMYDPRSLCRLLGLRDHRQLDPLLAELTAHGKLIIADGKVSNRRAECEIEAAHKRMARSSAGGRAKASAKSTEKLPRETASRSASGGNLDPICPPIQRAGIQENQSVGSCHHRHHHREVPPVVPHTRHQDDLPQHAFAFEGDVIRLTEADFDAWRSIFHTIPDLRAELASIDAWCTRRLTTEAERKGWFHRVKAMLNKKHQANLGQQDDRHRSPAADYWREIEEGVIH